jgi:hypothetical protein
MNDNELQQHLSQIATQWSVLYQAHKGDETEAARARQLLMQRYCGAVYRYLLRAVPDPSQGRFRNYVKGALFRLVQDHHRSQGKGLKAVSLEAEEVADPHDEAAERDFRESWRQELLSRAWDALNAVQAESGQPYHDVLRLRADSPDLSSTEMAETLSARLGRTISPANLRQLLHRARERFAELLLDEVCQSLEGASIEQVEEELAELNLLKYCQDVLQRRQS